MITAVFCSYWRERSRHAQLIVKALLGGSVVPDKIIIFNNNNTLDLTVLAEKYPQVQVIQSTENYGHRARFIAAMLQPSDYYFFIDDDMLPNTQTIENYMKYAHPDCCLTHLGRKLSPEGTYNRGGYMLRSSEVTELTPSALVIGVGSIFCSFNALARMVELEMTLRTKTVYNDGREADIILGMANKSAVVPTDKNSELKQLGQKGVGMFLQEGHNVMRNTITKVIYDLKKGTHESLD